MFFIQLVQHKLISALTVPIFGRMKMDGVNVVHSGLKSEVEE
jgi:hypothetical protein